MQFTFSNLIDGLEGICNVHTQLGAGKFFRTDEEFNQKMNSTSGYAMLLSPISGGLRGQNEASIYKYFRAGFCINHPWQIGDHDTMQSVLTECERIAHEVLARMRYNSTTMENTTYIFDNFDFNTVRTEIIYLELDQRIGIDVTFEVYEMDDLVIDTSDAAGRWTDLP